ncbi:MAG: GNAT family N-acetyltransferase [Chloroflexi bacterium]|nr:GNAT family N-acetyltransferase [Chloroflexota bacterium]
MELTSMRAADLPACLELLRAGGRHPRLTSAWLEHCTLGDPTSTGDLRVLAWQGDALVGVCLACQRSGAGILKWFEVRADLRRQKIGSALLGELETRLRALGVTQLEVKAVAPNYMAPGVDIRFTDAICFLLDHRFKTDRNAIVDMTVDLARAHLDTAATEQSLAEQGICVRRATAAEVPAVAAFALREFSVGWLQEVSEAVRYEPTPLYAAFRDGEVLSFAVTEVTGPARFGPTGTRRDLRGRGLGGALLKMALRDLRERGYADAEIGWVGPLSYYARLVGAEITRAYWRFEKTLA